MADDKNVKDPSLVARGWTRFSGSAKSVQKDHPGGVILGEYLFLRNTYNDSIKKIETLSEAAGSAGVSLADLSTELDFSRAALKVLLGFLEKEGRGALKKSRFYGLSAFKLKELSPFDRSNLDRLREAGAAGLETTRIKMAGIQESLERLTSRGLAVDLTDTLFWDVNVLADKRAELMKGRGLDQSITIDEAREATGLSRRFLLPLFESLEVDGYLEREEESRRVIRIY